MKNPKGNRVTIKDIAKYAGYSFKINIVITTLLNYNNKKNLITVRKIYG